VAVDLQERADEAAMADPGETGRSGASRPHRRGGRSKVAAHLNTARPPLAAIGWVRLVLAALMAVMCLLTAGGALLMLMAWRQDQTDGLATGQTERLWDVWSVLADVERYAAYAALAVAMLWIALATVNVRRGTAHKRNPVLAAGALPLGAFGAWIVADRVVVPAEQWWQTAYGLALEAVFVALPVLALERVADAAEARHRPLRVMFVTAVGYLVTLQTLGALSTIDRTTDLDGWSRGGAYLMIATLLQMVTALAANEACRALEEGTRHRFELRHRFGEALIAQAGL